MRILVQATPTDKPSPTMTFLPRAFRISSMTEKKRAGRGGAVRGGEGEERVDILNWKGVEHEFCCCWAVGGEMWDGWARKSLHEVHAIVMRAMVRVRAKRPLYADHFYTESPHSLSTSRHRFCKSALKANTTAYYSVSRVR